MGQALSRRVVPRLNNALQRYENAATKDAMDDMAKRQSLARSGKTGGYSDPNAVHGGFRRENVDVTKQLPQEAAQEEFLRSSASQNAGAQTEMPDDLLKFLNDNPLEKHVDRELTSPKVLDSMQQQQQQQQEGDSKEPAKKQRTPRTRTRRTMPLAESMVEDLPEGVASDIVGATVQRTTNFSTAEVEEDDEAELDRLLRMTDKELAGLLRTCGTTAATSTASAAGGDISNNESSSVDLASRLEAKKKEAESYLSDRLPPKLKDDTTKKTAHIDLVANALVYNGMPVLMKDVDSDYVGVWSGRVPDMERMKLKPVTEEETTLVWEKRVKGDSEGQSSASGHDVSTSEASGTGEMHICKESKANITDSSIATETATDATEKSEKITSEDEQWEETVMEEKKKIKSRIGSSAAASRKFLEEELAKAEATRGAAEKA